MTFEEFRATGRDVDDLLVVDPGHFEAYDYVVNGRVYMDTLWCVPCVTSGVGWMTIIGNCEYQAPSLEAIERILYRYALETR